MTLTERIGGLSRAGMVLVSLVAAGLLTPLHGEVPSAAAVAHFDSLEATILDIVSDDQTRSTSLRTTTRYFNKLLKAYPEIHDILRINSKGKVTNEVARDGKVGRRYRSVAGQRWFRAVGPGMEPYYGKVRTRRGRYMLFWAMPILVENSRGSDVSGGALLVKLDLAACFEGAATRIDRPFRVYFDNKRIYSHQWRDIDSYESSHFDIKGMDGLTIRYERSGDAPVAEPEPAEQSADDEAAADDETVEEKTKGEEPTAVTPAGEEPEKRSGLLLIFIPMLLVIAAVLIVFIVIKVREAMHLRNEQLMAQIDAGDSPTREPATTRIPNPNASPVGAPPQPADGPSEVGYDPMGATQPIPMGGGAGPMGADPMGVTQPIPMPLPGGPAKPPKPEPPKPAVPSGPPTSPPGTLSAGTTLSIDDYEKVRQQLRNELTPQIKEQLQKALDSERAEIKKGAEAFGSEVTMLLHDLIGRISEMGDDPTGLTATVAATIHELNGLVNRYRDKG